jgi:16S rRNA (guanine966-N2)-methyltransferase
MPPKRKRPPEPKPRGAAPKPEPAPLPARRLRVIAGSMRGRRLLCPPGESVRPTKDFVREAVFSALDSRGAIVDAVVLDLYSGTGALAVEALSRGATNALLVERDRAALDAIDHNLDQLQLGARARVQRADVASVLAGAPPREAPFDLVIADPPYETSDDEIAELLAGLAVPGWLAPDALIVVERPARVEIKVPDGFRACWERTFGDTLVFFVDVLDPSI